jgi:hypothetical protein
MYVDDNMYKSIFLNSLVDYKDLIYKAILTDYNSRFESSSKNESFDR